MSPYAKDVDKTENIYKSRKSIMFNNFLGGIAWGLGATVGVSIFFAVIAFLLSKLDLVPVVGKFMSNVATYVMQNNPHLR